jgi:hypothetical protein
MEVCTRVSLISTIALCRVLISLESPAWSQTGSELTPNQRPPQLAPIWIGLRRSRELHRCCSHSEHIDNAVQRRRRAGQ